MRGPAPRSPRWATWTWLGLLALWLGAGCQAPGTASAPGAPPGQAGAAPELVVWHAYRGAEQAALTSLALRFQAEAPHVGLGALSVRLVAIPYDAFPNKVTVAVPRGNGPDVFIFAHDRVGDWAAAGLLEPLGHWAEAEQLAAFFRPTVTALVVDGQLYGLPLAFKTLALYRNTRLAPEAPADTDALVAHARYLRAREAAVWGLGYELDSLYFHAPWLHGFGGAVFGSAPGASDPATPTGEAEAADGPLALNSEAAARSLAFVRRLVAEERIVPPEATSALVTALFRQGELAYVISGPWFRGELGDVDHWAVAPMPIVSETGLPARPFLGVEAALVSAHGHHKHLAWAFARFLTTEAAAAERLGAGQLVANRAQYDRPAVQADAFIQAFRAQVDRAAPLSNRPAMRAVWTPAKQALSKAIVHGQDPRAVLAEASAAIERALR